jgi:hypothetical protein
MEIWVAVVRAPIHMRYTDRRVLTAMGFLASYEKRMDIARTERLTEEVWARAGIRLASGSEGDWGARANI